MRCASTIRSVLSPRSIARPSARHISPSAPGWSRANWLASRLARSLTQRRLRQISTKARRRGFTSDDEEFSPGVRCVAAPIRKEGGTIVAAVGLSGPTARIDLARLEDLGQLVRDRSNKVSPNGKG